MNKDEWEEKLRAEGFTDVSTWHDGSDVFYPTHSHNVLTAHVIIAGSMLLDVDGKEHILQTGERFDIPAGTRHSARMGPAGCTYTVGEKVA